MADGKNRKNELNTNKIINQYYNSEDGKQLKKRFQNAEDEDIGKALIVIGLIRSFISTESFYVSNGSVTEKELIKIQQKPNFQKFEVFLNQYNSLQGLRDSKGGFFSITEYNENKKEFFNRLLYLEKLTQKDISKLSLGFNNIVKLHKFFDNRRRDIKKSKRIPQDRSSKLIDERKLDKNSQIYEALSTMSSKITEGMLPEDVNIEKSALKDIDLARKTVSNFLETNGVKEERKSINNNVSKSINNNVSTTDEVHENELNNIGDIFESIGKKNDIKNKTTPEFYKRNDNFNKSSANIKDLARQTMSNINDIKKDIKDIEDAENRLRSTMGNFRKIDKRPYNSQQGNTGNDNVEKKINNEEPNQEVPNDDFDLKNKINEENGKFVESFEILSSGKTDLTSDEKKSINKITDEYNEWRGVEFPTLKEAEDVKMSQTTSGRFYDPQNIMEIINEEGKNGVGVNLSVKNSIGTNSVAIQTDFSDKEIIPEEIKNNTLDNKKLEEEKEEVVSKDAKDNEMPRVSNNNISGLNEEKTDKKTDKNKFNSKENNETGYQEEIPEEIIDYEELENKLKALDERFKNLSNLYNGIDDKGSGDLSTPKEEFEKFRTKYEEEKKEEIDNKMEDVNQKEDFDTYKGMLDWINQKSDEFDNWFDKIWRGKRENFETRYNKLRLQFAIQKNGNQDLNNEIESLIEFGAEIDGEGIENNETKENNKPKQETSYKQKAEVLKAEYERILENKRNTNEKEGNDLRQNLRNKEEEDIELTIDDSGGNKKNLKEGNGVNDSANKGSDNKENTLPSNINKTNNNGNNGKNNKSNQHKEDASFIIEGGLNVEKGKDGKYNGTIVVTPKDVNDYYKKVCEQIKGEKEKSEVKQVAENIKNDLDKFADTNDKNNENGSIGRNVVKKFKDIIQSEISEELKNKLKEGGMTVDENGNIQIKSARQATQLWQSILDQETDPKKKEEYQKVFMAMAYVCDDMVKSHEKANELKDISADLSYFAKNGQKQGHVELKEVEKPELLKTEIKNEGVVVPQKTEPGPENKTKKETAEKVEKWKKEIDAIGNLEGIKNFCNPNKDRNEDAAEKNKLWGDHISPLVDGRVVEILKNEKNIEGNEKIKGSLDAIFYSRNAQGFDPKKICEEHRGTIEEIYNKAKSAQKGVEFSEKVNKDQQKVLPNTQPPGYWASKEDERKNQSGTSRYV